MFNIEFYELPNGEVPVIDFLESLNLKMRDKAYMSFELLKEFGNNMREPYSKYLGNGLFELRIRFSNDIARVFYFFYDGEKIVLTNGFIKKRKKTPPRELEKARKYMKDYLERKENNE